MAITQSFLAQNRAGNRVEKYIKVTFTGVTEGIIETGLKNVIVAAATQIGPSGGTVDNSVRVWPNYEDAGSTDAAGKVFMDTVTSNGVYSLRVIGN